MSTWTAGRVSSRRSEHFEEWIPMRQSANFSEFRPADACLSRPRRRNPLSLNRLKPSSGLHGRPRANKIQGFLHLLKFREIADRIHIHVGIGDVHPPGIPPRGLGEEPQRLATVGGVDPGGLREDI